MSDDRSLDDLDGSGEVGDVLDGTTDETRAAFALIDAAEWIELSLGGGFDAAVRAALDVEPEIAIAALLKAAENLAVVAGGYANGADESVDAAAIRLLHDLREDFGRAGDS